MTLKALPGIGTGFWLYNAVWRIILPPIVSFSEPQQMEEMKQKAVKQFAVGTVLVILYYFCTIRQRNWRSFAGIKNVYAIPSPTLKYRKEIAEILNKETSATQTHIALIELLGFRKSDSSKNWNLFNGYKK